MFQAYLISCLIDGKVYVGITSRSIRQRWNEHTYFARKSRGRMTVAYAIAKHGPGNFRIDPVCSMRSWADACEIERLLIAQHDCIAPRGYNLRAGGEGAYGRKPSADAVERSAAKHRGNPCHPNTRAAAQARRGIKKPDGFGAKIAASRVGKPRSEETKQKLRAYWAARRAAGQFKTSEPYAHSRKFASAMIAKIPLPLSCHIARVFKPDSDIERAA